MKGSSNRKSLSSMSVSASETTGTHLAHWPPPQRGKESKPVFIKHVAGEPAKRAKARGWRLTRARSSRNSPTTNSDAYFVGFFSSFLPPVFISR
ncbi:hypothetical protein ACVIN2_000376 [Bradyrhizobium sp. USDA 3650]